MVFLPTLKLDQVRIAFCAVCWMVTVVWPLLVDWVGRLAFCHKVGSLPMPGATCKPPAPSPSGTLLDAPSAALRAAFCTACMACSAWVARVSDCIDCWVADAACCADTIAAAAALVAAGR